MPKSNFVFKKRKVKTNDKDRQLKDKTKNLENTRKRSIDVVKSGRRHRRSSVAEEPSRLTVVPFTHFPQNLSKVQNGFCL